jgi:hypothetical protein
MWAAEIVVDHPWFVFITGSLVPLVTGIITTFKLSGFIKGLITLFLNSVIAFLTINTIDGTAVFSSQTLYIALFGFALSVVNYTALWRNTPLTSSKKENWLFPGFGIGKKETANE